MADYTFKITHEGKDAHETTLDLPDLKSAWEEATITAGHMLKDLDGSLSAKTEWSVQILDAKGKLIRTIRISTEAYQK